MFTIEFIAPFSQQKSPLTICKSNALLNRPMTFSLLLWFTHLLLDFYYYNYFYLYFSLFLGYFFILSPVLKLCQQNQNSISGFRNVLEVVITKILLLCLLNTWLKSSIVSSYFSMEWKVTIYHQILINHRHACLQLQMKLQKLNWLRAKDKGEKSAYLIH